MERHVADPERPEAEFIDAARQRKLARHVRAYVGHLHDREHEAERKAFRSIDAVEAWMPRRHRRVVDADIHGARPPLPVPCRFCR